MRIYTIRSGDTLSSVAQEFGVPMEDIVRDNQLANPDRVVVGQSLVIAGASGATFTVRPGDTLSAIARMYSTTVAALVAANPFITNPDRIYPGQVLTLPAGAGTTHTVRQGDTLSAIARMHNTTVAALLQANPFITNPDYILPGQILSIPSGSAAAKRSIRTNGYCYININSGVLETTLPYLTYISPFSYEIRADGSLSAFNPSNVVAAARGRNVASLMVITNYDENAGGFSSELAGAVLRSVRVQETLLNNIVSTINARGFTGLDVDFEYVLARDRENFNAFLERAVQRLHPLGYTVSTTLPAIETEGQPGLLYEGMDFAAHGRIVDWSLIMTYDWGYRYSPPMAVSPLNRVERALQYALSKIPREKILMGIPNYGYDWIIPFETGRPAQLIMNIPAVTLAGQHWSEIHFDETAQTPFFHYNDAQGQRHEVWFDDARSMDAKFALIEKYGLLGLGYWNINTLFYPGWLVLGDRYNIEKVELD